MKPIILDLCGGTGAWSRPWAESGEYDVRLITLPDYDVRTYQPPENVFGILAAPPCECFSRALAMPRDKREYSKGIEILEACMKIIWKVQSKGTPLSFWVIENPNGMMHKFLGRSYFNFQPWEFGETDFRATKRTWLWGYFKVPRKKTTTRDYEKIKKVSPYSRKDGSPFDRKLLNKGFLKATAEERAITPPGFAKAFFEANRMSQEELAAWGTSPARQEGG